jgi:hypothetical protein
MLSQIDIRDEEPILRVVALGKPFRGGAHDYFNSCQSMFAFHDTIVVDQDHGPTIIPRIIEIYNEDGLI